MSSANRSTFTPARGGTSQGGTLASIPTTKVSARDLPSQRTLKRRLPPAAKPAVAADIVSDASISAIPTLDTATHFASLIKLDENLARFAEQDKDAVSSDDDEEPIKRSKQSDDEDEGSSSGDESDEELQRELESLRKERAVAAEAKAKSEKTQLERLAESLEETKVAKSWDEDTVFRVAVKEDRATKPVFINDSVRSEFHKRFLKKYIL